MPSETFNHLPLEKKQMIINAAKKEFSSVSYHEASINKIIKGASISRGSFYMYFKDKEDLYVTITKHECEEMIQKMVCKLNENKGDLFVTYKTIYTNLLEKVTNQESSSLQQNVLLNMNFKSDQLTFENMIKDHQKDVEEFLNAVDTSRLLLETKEELFDVVDMLNLLLIHSLVLIVKEKGNPTKVRMRYERQLDIIKQGVERKIV